MSNNRPDYRLKMKPKHGGYACDLGVAWNVDGPHGNFISVRLNPGVVLSHRDMADHFISLFPVVARESADELETTTSRTSFDDGVANAEYTQDFPNTEPQALGPNPDGADDIDF